MLNLTVGIIQEIDTGNAKHLTGGTLLGFAGASMDQRESVRRSLSMTHQAAPLPGAKDRERFFSASVAFTGSGLAVTPHVPQGSHDLAAYGLGTALVRVPAGAAPAPAGNPCEVLPLADWRQG